MADLIERRGMVRAVKYVEKDGGLWSMTCDECPLPHSEALGQDAPRCASGIATRMQGPVPLQTCHNLAHDSYANTTDGGITITCNYVDAPSQRQTEAGMAEKLGERLRAVEWEETDDGDRMPDDPTHKCVFVDMRPNDFRALLREAAAALEAAREDAERYRWLRCEAARHKAGDDPGALRVSVTYNPKRSDGNGFTGMLVTPMGDDFDAAIDQARGKGVRDA